MRKDFKFSIVMAIYNMELYLEDAIKSIIDQTIGFEDNIQILFVNDGSTDHSESICKKYERCYPDNIFYIGKENSGVSDTRNKGLEYATGELINFLDADDKLDIDALEKVYRFYLEYKDEIDLISIPLYFFEGKEGGHVLNYKFTSSRVIDIFKEPKCFQMSISSCFIRRESLEGHLLSTKLKYGEDAQVANKIILSKGKYGVVSDTKYWYRHRNTGSSAIQGAKANKENYIPPLKYLHLELIEFAKEKYGQVPEYLQWMLIYDLGWKIRVPFVEESVLSPEEIEEFLSLASKILSHISDDIILGNSYLRRCFYFYMLQLKYGSLDKQQLKLLANKEEAVLCKENSVIDILSLQAISIERIEKKEEGILLIGSFQMPFDMYDFEIRTVVNGEEESILHELNENARLYSLNRMILEGYKFSLAIPKLHKYYTIQFYAVVNQSKVPLKLVIRDNELIRSEIKNLNYDILCKDRTMIIKKIHDVLNMTSKKVSNNTLVLDKGCNELVKLYELNKGKVLLFTKIFGISKVAQAEKIIENLTEEEILSIPDKFIPFSYRYFFAYQMKNKANSVLNIATIYNQAFFYNHNGWLVAKATDMEVKIQLICAKEEKISVTGSINSPLFTDCMKLYCACHNKRILCDLKKNDTYTEKFFELNINHTYEFHIDIGRKAETELNFILCYNLAQVNLHVKLDKVTEEFKRRSGIRVKVLDKKRLLLTDNS